MTEGRVSPIKIFSGTASTYLSEKIVKSLGTELGKTQILRFSDGEFSPSYLESVRGCTVFIIQSTFPPAENLFELLLLIDAAKRASAKTIVAVIPYFGLARQDSKDRPRAAIGAKLVANLLIAAGVNRIMTMDFHSNQLQAFFDIPVDHLYASAIFVPYINSLQLDNLIIASPDVGGSKRANAYSRFLKTEMVICYKHRMKANHIADFKVIGDVKNKNVIIIDDLVDTAGTATIAVDTMLAEGAKSIRMFATHAVLSGPAYERIENSGITKLFVTDSIPLKKESKKITVLTLSDLFADTIKKVYNYQSISSNFII